MEHGLPMSKGGANPMATWTVEVRLIKTSGEPPEVKARKFEQITANEVYRKIVKELDEKHPEVQP